MPQVLTQKQTQKQSPQQYLVATMLECTADELEQRINEELVRNIALEPDDHSDPDIAPEDTSADRTLGDDDEDGGGDEPIEGSDAGTDAGGETALFDYYDDEQPNPNRSPDDTDRSPLTNYRTETTFREDLKNQLALLDVTEEERYLATYLIESLEDNGYLLRPLAELVDDLEFTQRHTTTEAAVEAVLTGIVQGLEPAGIGARSVRECLRLQLLDRRGSPAASLAYRIVDEAFDDFSHRRYERLCQTLGVTMAEVEAAQRVIRSLSPHPGGMQADVDVARVKAGHVRPDFVVRNEDGRLVLTLNDRHVPDVRISPDYLRMLEQLQQTRSRNEDHRRGATMIRESMASARSFIDALRQRRRTLMAVMQVVVAMQRDYFLTGDRERLRPMVLREVAERSGYDVSTVSRMSRSKYVETDFGIIAVKDLFTTAVPTTAAATARADADGTAPAATATVSNVVVKDALRRLIDAEDKHNPLTDETLAARLAEMGYPIARRTAMKYRTELGYNKAGLRREV